MKRTVRVLVLAGTREARELCARLEADDRFRVTASLAGATRSPAVLARDVRGGGFGGVEGLAHYLRDERIDALVDATHPFAARMSANAAGACAQARVPRVRLLRPAWEAGVGDRWHEVADLDAARACVERLGMRAFLALGHQHVDAFSGLEHLGLVVRAIEPRPVQLRLAERVAGGAGRGPLDAPQPPGLRLAESVAWIVARGPFDEAAEVRTLRKARAGVLVCRNSGGDDGAAKLEAARTLGLQVVMVARPPQPSGEQVASVEAAWRWLRALATAHAE